MRVLGLRGELAGTLTPGGQPAFFEPVAAGMDHHLHRRHIGGGGGADGEGHGRVPLQEGSDAEMESDDFEELGVAILPVGAGFQT
jgi:hypothetical protein